MRCLSLAEALFRCPSTFFQFGWRVGFLQALLFSTAVAQLQNPIVEHFDSKQGLSHNTVTDVVQDDFGFLWVATHDGLNRFDGYSFKTYTHLANNPNSLPHSTVFDLCLDHRGNLWIGTASGLAQFSLNTETFTCYLSAYQDSVGYRINSIVADSAGGIWIGTTRGLYYFQPAQQTWQAWLKETSELYSNTISKLYLDSRGVLWIHHAYASMQIFNTKTATFAAFSHASVNTFSSVYEDCDHTIWLSTPQGALWRYCPSSRSNDSMTVFFSSSVARFVDQVGIMSAFEDYHERLWFGIHSIGILIVERQSAKILRFISAEEFAQVGLLSPYLFCMFHDKSGIIWTGTDIGGLYKYDWKRELFQSYKPITTHSSTYPMIRGIHADTSGTAWVCTQGSGLFKLERHHHTLKWTRYDSHSKGLPTDFLWSIRKMPNGEFWIGGNNALIHFNPKTETFRSEPLPFGNVSVIYPDEHLNLWLGTDEGVLFRDAQTGQFKVLKNPFSPEQKFRHVEALYKEGETIWIGTLSGLYRAHASRFEVERHYAFPTPWVSSASATDMYVTCIYRDSSGKLWLCTKGSGLYILKDTLTGEFESLTTADGLSHNHTYAILEDRLGQLWISTDRGISLYNPRTKRFRIFTTDDGLQDNEFNRQAYFKSASGEFFFGGISGLNSFFPEQLSQTSFTTSPILIAFKKYNDVVALDTAIYQRHSLELYHTDNFFSLEFATTDFHTPDQKVYRYKLDGYDKDWILTDALRREAIYRNLPAGEYVFQLQVKYANDSWSDDKTSLQIVMHPAPWRTWWAYSAYLLLGIGAVLLFVRYRTHQLQEENLRLDALVHARTQEILQKNQLLEAQSKELVKLNDLRLQFFSMAAHDLKNPLQSISGFSRLIEETLHLETIKLYAQYISHAATRMLGLIEELLETASFDLGKVSLNKQPIDIRTVLETAVKNVETLATQKSQSITLQLSQMPIIVLADVGRMTGVFENLLSNAVKYSFPNTSITVCCHKLLPSQMHGSHQTADLLRAHHALSEPFVLISVSDEGQGLTAADMQKLFGRFQRLSARPTHGESSSGLGLSLVKEIVEMHGGKVWAESLGKDQGATFFVALPIVQE